MSSGSKGKSPTITGVDPSKFENFITAGSSLAADPSQNLAIKRQTKKSAKATHLRSSSPLLNKTRGGATPPGGFNKGPARLGAIRRLTREERFERADLVDISQADLDNLASNFTQRKSSIIAKRQQPGREQLILSRENV